MLPSGSVRSRAAKRFHAGVLRSTSKLLFTNCEGSNSVAAPTLSRRNATTSRSEEHTSELQSLMRISYAVFCLKKKKNKQRNTEINKLKCEMEMRYCYENHNN